MPIIAESIASVLAIAASMVIYFKFLDKRLDAMLDKAFEKKALDEEFSDQHDRGESHADPHDMTRLYLEAFLDLEVPDKAGSRLRHVRPFFLGHIVNDSGKYLSC